MIYELASLMQSVFLTVIYSYVYIADKIGDYELFYIIISDLHMLDSMHYDALYAYTTHTMQKCKLAVIYLLHMRCTTLLHRDHFWRSIGCGTSWYFILIFSGATSSECCI